MSDKTGNAISGSVAELRYGVVLHAVAVGFFESCFLLWNLSAHYTDGGRGLLPLPCVFFGLPGCCCGIGFPMERLEFGIFIGP